MTALSERVTDVLHTIAAETGGRPRAGQDQLAVAVARAIEAHQHVALQAATGTGKSRGVTLPFAMAGLRTFISTGTLVLQDQYDGHDLPIIVNHLASAGYGRRKVAVLKGRANYPCLLECDTALAGEQTLFDDGRATGGVTKDVARWALRAPGGTEWKDAPRRVPIDVRAQLSVSPDECLGRRCKFYDDCHATIARREARLADLIVINHALLCSNVTHGGKLLPVADDETVAFVIDEAHLLESAAEQAFGQRLAFRSSRNGSEHGHMADLADAIGKLGVHRDFDDALPTDLLSVAKVLRSKAVDLLDEGRVKERTVTPFERDGLFGPAIAALDEVRLRSEVAASCYEPQTDREALLLKRIGVKLDAIGEVVAGFRATTPNIVTHLERAGNGARIVMTDINCGPWLSRRAWHDPRGRPRPVVLTSATIPDGYAARIGLDVPTVEIGSPFALGLRQLIYVADTLPSPSKARAAWEQQAPQVAYQLADAALHTGSVLVLCTSWRMVQAYDVALSNLTLGHPDVRLLIDSEQQLTGDLVSAFERAHRAVLISAQGAWTGLDLPGKVRAVIVPAVPMPVPGDPLNEARKQLWPSPLLPHPIDRATAAAKLAQGLGRLMRCDTDWGVCAVLDPRVTRSSYSWDLRSKLPHQSLIVGDQYRGHVLDWLRVGPAAA